MRYFNIQLYIFLIIIWSVFFVWEYQIQEMGSSMLNQIIRYDLMILPILLFITVYTLYNIYKSQKN